MKDLEQQCGCAKFIFKLGKTFTETFQMLQQAYGEDCMSRTPCHDWYQRFESGRTSIEGDPKSGRSSTSMDDDRVEKVLAVIRKNVPRGETVNKEFYLNVLKRLRAAIQRKKPEAWTNNTWMLHHEMHLLTHHSLSVNVLRSMRRLLSPSRPTLQILPLLNFSFSRSWNPH